MNQRQAQPDGDAGETCRCFLVGGAEDDDQEHHGHHDFGNKTGSQGVSARRMIPVSVRRQSAGDIESGLPAGDVVQDARTRYCTRNLCKDIRQQFGSRKSATGPQPNGYGRIKMTARDRSDRINHGEYSQAEGQRDAYKTDTDIRKPCGEYRATASAEYQPERADEFGT